MTPEHVQALVKLADQENRSVSNLLLTLGLERAAEIGLQLKLEDILPPDSDETHDEPVPDNRIQIDSRNTQLAFHDAIDGPFRPRFDLDPDGVVRVEPA